MIEHWNTAAHVILNLGSTLFLGVGNYSMQVLVAPTRREADKRHEKGKSLDIGIHSFRNLRWIAWKRVIIWAFLGAIATVLHLFWNSLLFHSLPFRAFPVAVVTADFQTANDS